MTSDVAVGRREPASGPGGSGRREPASGPGGSGRREPASGPGGPARGSDLSAAVADAFTREVGSRLPGLRSWLAAAVRPGAEPDADGLAEALRAAHTLASGAAVVGLASPAAFLRAAELALSGAERPDRSSYELARAQRLVERAAAALAIPAQGS